MEWGIILLGVTLAIIFISRQDRHSRKSRKSPIEPVREYTPPRRINLVPPQYDHVPGDDSRFQIPNLPLPPSTYAELGLRTRYPWIFPRIGIQPLTRNENRRERALVQNWKNSIVGLIRLADQNLQLAQRYMSEGVFVQAIVTANTSLENISRALIHCYGGKPDTETGQEEPLKLICGRFKGSEKEEFEKGISAIGEIGVYVRNVPQTSEPNQSQIRKMLESAMHTVDLFKRVLTENFAAEISELSEACPKCHSLNIWTGSSNPAQASCECQNCRHKWVEDRH